MYQVTLDGDDSVYGGPYRTLDQGIRMFEIDLVLIVMIVFLNHSNEGTLEVQMFPGIRNNQNLF